MCADDPVNQGLQLNWRRKTGGTTALVDIYCGDKGVLIGGTKQGRTKQLLRPANEGEAAKTLRSHTVAWWQSSKRIESDRFLFWKNTIDFYVLYVGDWKRNLTVWLFTQIAIIVILLLDMIMWHWRGRLVYCVYYKSSCSHYLVKRRVLNETHWRSITS